MLPSGSVRPFLLWRSHLSRHGSSTRTGSPREVEQWHGVDARDGCPQDWRGIGQAVEAATPRAGGGGIGPTLRVGGIAGI